MASSVYCPECGSDNDELLHTCGACGALLDADAAAVQAAARAPRPFHLRTFAMMAGLGVTLVLLAQLLGLSFCVAVVPSSISEGVPKIEALVDAGTLDAEEGRVIALDLMRNEAMRAELEHGRVDGAEAMRLRERVRPEDQSLVLGMGGLRGFLPPFLALLMAAFVTVGVCRVRRSSELGLGVTVAATMQLGLWAFLAELELGALLGGELLMTQGGFGFAGAPIMLLGMWAFLSVVVTVGAAHAIVALLEPLTGMAVCDACEHRFRVRPKAPEACPKCKATRGVGGRVRYRGGEDMLAELGPASAGTTLASSGAAELLCLRCAKTYAADQCPHHPHEPLLDPRLDAVRFQLMELDASAGTRRYSKWTADGLGIDAAGPARPAAGPLLCMACARTYVSGSCSVHPDEPLLDPSREEVRLELVAADDRRRARASTGLMFGSTIVAGLLSFGLAGFLDLGGSTGITMFVGLLVFLVPLSQLVTPRLAPPRFAAWTGEGSVDLDEMGMGAQATIVDPLRRAAARARRELMRLALAAALGAALGSGVALVLDQPIEALAAAGGLGSVLVTLMVLIVIDRLRTVGGAVRQAQQVWNDPYAERDQDT
jgi:hypothetical protein